MTKPTEEEKLQSKWHVDRTIPLALVIVLLGQTGGAIWWASSLSSRVGTLEDKFKTSDEKFKTSDEKIEKLSDIAVDIATLKEKSISTNEDVSDIKRSVELLTQQVLQEKRR
jgi:hypothetical protein